MKARVSDLFATLWPALMLLTLHLFFSIFFEPFINLYLLFGLVFLADLAAFYLYRIYSRMRGNHTLMVFRLLIFYLAAAWLVYKLLSGEFFHGIYTPLTVGGMYTTGLCLIGWSLTLFFARPLIYREKFMALFEDVPTGELPSKTRQYSYELQELKEMIKKIRLFPLVFTIITLVLLIALSFATGRVYAYQLIVYLMVLILCLSTIFFTRGMDEETMLISEGIRLDPDWTGLKSRRFFLILLALSVPALLLSQADFFLPYSLIGDFFAWLDSLIQIENTGEREMVMQLPQVQHQSGGMGSMMDMIGPVEQREPLLSDRAKEIIKRIFIGAGIGVFLYFLVFPFLKRNSRKEGARILKQGFKEIVRYFLNLMSLFKPGTGKKEKKSRKRKQALRSSAKRKVRQEKAKAAFRQELPSANKIIRSFNKLARWAGRRHRPYSVGTSPADYVRRLTEFLPHRRKELAGMALFLDRYFYSDQIIESTEIDNFIQLTNRLMKEERRRQ